MSVAMIETHLPDPVDQPDFYAGIPLKRALAWVIDTLIIGTLAAIVATLPLFIGWFFYPLIFLVLSFCYRTATIASRSATWGMRLMNIELRSRTGQHLDQTEAMMHTGGYLLATTFLLPQLLSILLITINPRHQGLHDLLCGTAAINKPSRY